MFSKKLATLAVVTAGLSVAAAGMSVAAEPANTIGCVHMSKEVTQALDAHQQSDNYEAAKGQQRMGQRACMDGQYSLGLSHYAKALEMLGATSG